jgi:hypothetical protein
LGTIIFNLLVIVLLWFKKTSKLSVFNKVLIGHAFVDGLTGLISMPLFHISSIFGYWPLPNIIGQLWAIYDSNINITTNLHMLYMSYIRLRSIQSPKHYSNEFLIKSPVLMMLSFWVVSLLTWFIIVLVIGLNEFSLSVAFDRKTQYIQFVIYFIGWFSPLMLILIFSIQIIKYLIIKSKRTSVQRQMINNSRDLMTITNNPTIDTNKTSINDSKKLRLEKFFRFKPQTIFLIIISTFWLQWIPPCILTLAQNICNNCINIDLYNDIYWLTYTVRNFIIKFLVFIFNFIYALKGMLGRPYSCSFA